MGRRKTIEEVRSLFLEKGYELLSNEYQNSSQILDCKCIKHPEKILNATYLDIYGNSVPCRNCNKKVRYTYEEVNEYYKNVGCSLLTKVWKTLKKTNLEFICSCGLTSSKTFESFRKSDCCNNCSQKRKANKRKLDYNFVKEAFSLRNCVLLETEYINNKTKMKYICSCGNQSVINYDSFSSGHKCRNCSNQAVSEKNSLNYEEVSQFFIKNECILISDSYINKKSELKYICRCGKISVDTFDRFKRVKSCRSCQDIKHYNVEDIRLFMNQYECELLFCDFKNVHSVVTYKCRCGNIEKKSFFNFKHSELKACSTCISDYRSKSLLLNYETVKSYYEKQGSILVSKEYNGCDVPLVFICRCGRKGESTYTSFQKSQSCSHCGLERIKAALIIDYDTVKARFTNSGYTLLSSNYIGSDEPLDYLCKCGKRITKTLRQFRDNPKCKECTSSFLSSRRKGVEMPHMRGENHPNWDFSKTDVERVQRRTIRELKVWRKDVYEKDSYTCQCCGDNKGGNLNAHHLDGYDWCKDLRFDVNNGITLCNICHQDFHSVFGYGSNTREQFEEYIEGISWNIQSIYYFENVNFG